MINKQLIAQDLQSIKWFFIRWVITPVVCIWVAFIIGVFLYNVLEPAFNYTIIPGR